MKKSAASQQESSSPGAEGSGGRAAAQQVERQQNNQQALRGSRLSLSKESSEARELIERRSRRLTLCLFLLVGAISSLTPFLSLHLINRVGLLLFESDLIQLRSSLITVINCFLFLLILDAIILLLDYYNSKLTRHRSRGALPTKHAASKQTQSRLHNRAMVACQRLLKLLVGFLAMVSVVSYLALALMVPHVVQIQRAPLATFDCSANMITIENCQQQFAALNDEQSSSVLLELLDQLVRGDLNGNSERLTRRLECLKYNNQYLDPADPFGAQASVPTRFLLHKCGLVCEPHRQQLHQFNDDLNANQHRPRHLVAPYGRLDSQANTTQVANVSSHEGDLGMPARASGQPGDGEMLSLKLCFSGEINGGSSNYKRYCIENLTSGSSHSATLTSNPSTTRFYRHGQHQDKTLTVGQLNAILSRVQVDELARQQQPQQQQRLQQQAANSDYQNVIAGSTAPAQPLLSPRLDQSTHYVNPIIQFESHFKNWPHLSRATGAFQEQQQQQQTPQSTSHEGPMRAGWCKYKPMPPFIVNNRPFNDIQCSLEHEYFMSTGSQQEPAYVGPNRLGHGATRFRRSNQAAGRIILKKSTHQPEEGAEEFRNERCNIQCKADILYQVRPLSSSTKNNDGERSRIGKLAPASTQIYYLPLKPCLVVLGDGDKLRTANYYLVIRSVADVSLLLTFILIDLLLLIESIDRKQFQFEANKRRLFSLLVALTFFPLLVATLFDLAASWLPATDNNQTRSYHNGYLIQLINERLIPSMSDALGRIYAYFKNDPRRAPSAMQGGHSQDPGMGSSEKEQLRDGLATSFDQQQELVVDNYIIPFLVYAFFMFALALNSFKLPPMGLKSPLARFASTEELGIAHNKPVGLPTGSLSAKLERASGRPGFGAKRSQSAQSLVRLNKSDSSKGALQIARLGPNRAAQAGAKRAALFAILTLFMGLQFNLSQMTQSQILLETFNIQNDFMRQQPSSHHPASDRPTKVATWFVLVANSGGTMFILLLSLLFSEELSIFLAQFCPFKPIPSAGEKFKAQNEMRFKSYLSISLITYSLRFFVLANMSQVSRMRWLLVILFQSTELLNFPLTWFVLASRAHELLAEGANFKRTLRKSASGLDGHQQQEQLQHQQQEEGARETLRLINVHLLVQSSLAFVYFALARFLALFLHSFHASLYLHSNNFDWFISTLYEGRYVSTQDPSNQQATKQNHSASPINQNEGASPSVQQQHQQQHQTDALFAPLPSERQTYLHASRSFIKYNSLVCLLIGSVFLSALAVAKYGQWKEERRRKELEEEARRKSLGSRDRDSDSIDERLSMDLKQIHLASRRQHRLPAQTTFGQQAGQATATTSLTHLPTAGKRLADESEEERPRARIHFRYDLGQHHGSPASSSSSASVSSSVSTSSAASRGSKGLQQRVASRPASRQQAGAAAAVSTTPEPNSSSSRSPEFRIPIIMEEEGEEEEEANGLSLEGRAESGEGEEPAFVRVERFEQKRMKRIKLVEDGENWSLGSVDDAPDPPGEFKHDWRPPSGQAASAAAAIATSPLPPGFADSDDDGAGERESESDKPIDEPDEQHRRRARNPKSGGAPFGLDEWSTPSGTRGLRAGDSRGGAEVEAAQALDRNNKRITFAPTTTFIDQHGAQSRRQFERGQPAVTTAEALMEARRANVSQRRQRFIASPEPSIDERLGPGGDEAVDDGGDRGDKTLRINDSLSLQFEHNADELARGALARAVDGDHDNFVDDDDDENDYDDDYGDNRHDSIEQRKC